MIIGVPREVKPDEYRVAVVPAGVETLVRHGHSVFIETDAGTGSGITNDDYEEAGAAVLASSGEIYARAEMIVKVKEPLPAEYQFLRSGQVVFTYFHFAASRELTDAMLGRGIVAIAYETVRSGTGTRPLLTPMSEIAGRMAIQEGARCLERPMKGRGILLSGVPGVEPANVLILGGGVVGTNAAKVAAGVGARVNLLDVNLDRLRYLDDIMPPNVHTLMSDSYAIRKYLRDADLVIGAVLIEGAKAPKLISRKDLSLMKPHSVIVDVSIDQGGCTETSRPTTHSDPVYLVDGIVHYCVSNMPGAVGRTSTYALTNATLPYVTMLADLGWQKAARRDEGFARGVNMAAGRLINQAVAETFGLDCSTL
jgi:alanine dehydrogenase